MTCSLIAEDAQPDVARLAQRSLESILAVVDRQSFAAGLAIRGEQPWLAYDGGRKWFVLGESQVVDLVADLRREGKELARVHGVRVAGACVMCLLVVERVGRFSK